MTEPTLEKDTTARPRVALVTCAALPNLYAEESAFVPMLVARGIAAEAVAWDAKDVDWRSFDLVVLRSTWDYFERFDAFSAWLDEVAAATRVCNPPALVRWNLDKIYLRDLEARGIRIVPTVFCAARTAVSLAAIVAAQGWTEAVLKPAVSGGAFRTHRFEARDAEKHQAEMNAILASCGVLIQPFFPEITSKGELSFFFFDGAFSHAVVKVPVTSDYRVQTQFGGTFARVDPEPSLLGQARRVLDALPVPPTYARIDGVCRDGDFYLMEAELIEPYLFLAGRNDAASLYIGAIERLVVSGEPAPRLPS